MHVERGPQGKILVFEVLAGAEIVQHIYEGLRSFPLPNVLPVYMREVFGEKHLCVDCTGLIPLSDFSRSDYIGTDIRNNFLSFLSSLFRAEDQFITRDYFIFDPQYVFFNKLERSFYWCCIPVSPTTGNLYSGAQSISDRLNILLSCEYVTSFFDESHRKTIWTSIMEDDERLLNSLSCQQNDQTSLNDSADSFYSDIRKPLLIQISLMCLALIIITVFKLSSSIFMNLLLPVYILVFGLSLLTILLFSKKERNNKSQNNEASDDNKDSGDNEFISLEKHSNDPLFSYPNAFLRKLSDEKKISKKGPQRYPILVNDFLIGSDSILCDMVIDDKSISDRHGRILKRDDSYFYMDVGSSSGSKIGDRSLYSHEEYPLTNEDILTFGDVHFQFHQYSY